MLNLKTSFNVKDIFYTIQCEGEQSGRPAVFVRFAGCNGWSGYERDRNKGPFPCSRWCDTDFTHGNKMSEDDLIYSVLQLIPERAHSFVVLTGGEPALQLTDSLLRRLKKEVTQVAIETNGSLRLPAEAFNCWLTVSPKTENIVQDKASELKLIYPTIPPEKFDGIFAMWRWLQPLHDSNWQKNTEAAVAYVKKHPRWNLSIQTQKYIGIA